ncbi:MAG: DEAD/DEAH box helicase, partial [Pseudomonadales bacterium]|nr:DEAD/DEAH box helicase [Pseudomonadales bacterium]
MATSDPNSARSNDDSGLSAPVTILRGVGSALAEKLERLGIRRVQDLLFHLPLRYEDRTRLTPIGSARAGQAVVIEGEIAASDVVFGRRRSLLARIADGTGHISMRLFHFSRQQQTQLRKGARIRCFGEVRIGSSGAELYHPEYRILSGTPPALSDRLTPVYPITEGVGQGRMRTLTEQAVALANRHRGRLGRDLVDALRLLHAPTPEVSLTALDAGAHPAQRRVALDELLAHHLSLLRARRSARARRAHALPAGGPLRDRLLASLPFTPTRAQTRAVAEIDADLARSTPAMRLVQGDVGSGKTLIAACAALRAAEHGRQIAFMAPTELLAEQHARTLATWFDPLGVHTAVLTGRLRAPERRRQEALVASGEASVVVGTHALFQGGVDFRDLALVIIDEQHRFGVHQRLALRNKGNDGDADTVPHQLVMTATPIPRTLAMSAYADLDLSVLDELPPGRTPVTTVVLDGDRRADV